MLLPIFRGAHILLTIVAVGANVTFAIWIQRATIDRDALPFTLRGIKGINDRLTNPAYVLVFLTGLGMVLLSDTSLLTPWILLSFLLTIILVVVGVFGYSTTLRNQIALAESVGADDDEYKAAAWRGTYLGIAAGVIVLIILLLMIYKPGLWA
jgi:uncharacterized membrane protein